MRLNKVVIAAATGAALALPSFALAHGDTHVTSVKQARSVAYSFRGPVARVNADAMTVAVSVKYANHHARRFVRHHVTFDVSKARLVVTDVNRDGKRNLRDVSRGDLARLRVQIRGRATRTGHPIKARRLISSGHPRLAPPVADPPSEVDDPSNNPDDPWDSVDDPADGLDDPPTDDFPPPDDPSDG